MRFLKRLLKKKEEFQVEDEIEEPLQEIEEDTLDLGWYWSENKEVWQMAKILERDRETHFYIIGATGTGKTKFLEFLIQQDIEKGNGFAVIDPHGDLIEDIKGFLASHLYNSELSGRVILIDPTDPEYTVIFNPLEKLPQTSPAEQAAELVSAFRKIWPDAWGPRMEEVLRNSLTGLGEAELTLADLPLFLTNENFRKIVLERIGHPIVRQYFERFNRLSEAARNQWIEPVLNKVNAFLTDDRIRQMLCFPKSSFNLRDIMDNRKILLIKLDKGKLKGHGDLLGSLLMAKIQMAAFSRSDLSPSRRVPFYLYIDEFQNYATESFLVTLSEARKYGLSLIIAHQSLSQISPEFRNLILGNCGIQVYFRVSRKDAEILAKEGFEYSGYNIKSISVTPSHSYYKFWSYTEEWEHYIEELQNLPPRSCYVKHKIKGGMIQIRTVEIEPTWKALGMGEEEYQNYLKSLTFGRRYLLEREKLREKELKKEIEKKEEIETKEREFLKFIAENPDKSVTEVYKALGLSIWKGNQIRDFLKERGFIEEIETRLGKKRRLAKFFIPTFKAFKILGKETPQGRGGPLHRHIQNLIKEKAISKGYLVKCEHQLSNGGILDLHLEKEGKKIAIEIIVTPKIQRASDHIKEYLAEDYDEIFCFFLDEDSLEKMRLENLSEQQIGKVKILPLKELSSFF